MRLLKIYLFALLISSNQILVAQEDATEGEAPSTVQQLLELVKEGQVREQSENAVREAEFMANKNKQASILAAEKRELARQERIADQLEAEYKKNEEILRVKEEAYKKELGSLVELFGHLQSASGRDQALWGSVLYSSLLLTSRFLSFLPLPPIPPYKEYRVYPVYLYRLSLVYSHSHLQPWQQDSYSQNAHSPFQYPT